MRPVYSSRGSRGGASRGGAGGGPAGGLDGVAPPASAPGAVGFGLGGTTAPHGRGGLEGAGLESVSPERRWEGSPLQGVASLKDEELEELLAEPLIDWPAWEARVSQMLEAGHSARESGESAVSNPIVRKAPLPPLEVSNLSLEDSSKSELTGRITVDSAAPSERNPEREGRPLYSTRGSRKFARHIPQPTSARGGGRSGTPRSNLPKPPANTPAHRAPPGGLATSRGKAGNHGSFAAGGGVASPQRGFRRAFHANRETAGSRHGSRWGEDAGASTPKGPGGGGGGGGGGDGTHGHAAFPRSKMEEELQKSAEETAAIGSDLAADSDSDERGADGEAEGFRKDGEGRGEGTAGGAGRSQSPSIMWRPSARVKLATDLPLELLRSGLLLPATGGGGSRPGAGSSEPGSMFSSPPPHGAGTSGRAGGGLGASLGGFSGLQSPGGAGHPSALSPWGAQKTLGRTGSRQGPKTSQAPPEPNSWVRGAEPKKPRKYGAWYIPPEEWASEMVRMEKEQMVHNPGGPIEFSEDKSKEAEELGEQIVSLYSSKMYKEYIRRCNHRVPHYLARVESPKANRRAEKETALLEFTARFHGTPAGG